MLFKQTSSTWLFNIVIMTCLSFSKTVEHKSCLKKFKVKEPHSFLLNICPEPKSQHFFEYSILFNVLYSLIKSQSIHLNVTITGL